MSTPVIDTLPKLESRPISVGIGLGGVVTDSMTQGLVALKVLKSQSTSNQSVAAPLMEMGLTVEGPLKKGEGFAAGLRLRVDQARSKVMAQTHQDETPKPLKKESSVYLSYQDIVKKDQVKPDSFTTIRIRGKEVKVTVPQAPNLSSFKKTLSVSSTPSRLLLLQKPEEKTQIVAMSILRPSTPFVEKVKPEVLSPKEELEIGLKKAETSGIDEDKIVANMFRTTLCFYRNHLEENRTLVEAAEQQPTNPKILKALKSSEKILKDFKEELFNDYNELINRGYIRNPSFEDEASSEVSSPSLSPIIGRLEDVD